MNGFFYVITAALCWSCGGVFLKFVDAGIGAISAYRYLAGLVTIILLNRTLPVFKIKNPDNTTDRTGTALLWLGGILFAITSFLYVCANRYTTAANAIFLQYTNPIWIILFGPAILGEKNSKIDYITIAGVLFGMIFFFASELVKGLSNINSRMLMGDGFAIISGFFMAFYTMIMRKQKNGKPVESSMLSQIIGFTVTLPFFFISPVPGRVSLIFLILCGVVNGALALFFYSLGLKKVPALTASLISILEPLMNPVWVLIFAGEVPTPACIAGGIIIIGFVAARTVIVGKSMSSRTNNS